MAEDATGRGIAEGAASIFRDKAGMRPAAMLVLAMLAGAQIAFGSIGFLVVQGVGGEVAGGLQLLSGLAFSAGLVMVMVTGTELFTGNTMFTLAAIAGRLGWGRLVFAWAIVWIGNLAGSLIAAWLFVAAGGGAAAGGQVGAAAIATMADKLDKGAGAVIASGVLANMLVCLAVWMAMSAKTVPAKVLGVIGPVTLFVAAGLEHSVANMSLLPIGWLEAEPAARPALAPLTLNLILSTAGNIVGGSLIALSLGWAHDAPKHPRQV